MKKSLGAKTILYPAPVLVVGTYNEDRTPNAMTAAWGGICCSVPPCIAISLREATLTYHNIVRCGAFTISIPSEQHVQAADYFGIVAGKVEDKFAVTGLTPVRSELVEAPYVEEFPLVLECRLAQTVKLGLHTQFVGEIVDVKANASVLNQAGLPDIRKVLPILFAPEPRTYHAVGRDLGMAFSIGKTR